MTRLIRLLAPIALVVGAARCSDSAPDVTPATIVISPASGGTIASATSITLTASVANAGGSSLSGQIIDWTTGDANVATVSSSGVVTGLRAGQTQITAAVGTVHSAPVTLTVTAGTAARLSIRSQPAGGASGIALTTQPVIEIQDAAGNLVTSATSTVTATISTGGGALSGSTAVAVAGIATFTSLSVAGAIGDRTLAFSVAGLTSETSSGFAVGPGAPAKLVMRTQPTGASSGAPLGTQPAVEIRDDAGNLVPTSTATVTAAIGAGGGTIAGSAATAASGVATFSALSVSSASGSHTLVFSSPGLATVTSANFMILSGQAAQLRIRVQPGAGTSGSALAQQPVIEVADANGNIASSSTVSVTATLATGGGSLSGRTVSTIDGVATFTSLAVTGLAGPRTMTFSSDGLTPVTSAPFSVSTGNGAQLVIVTQPAGARSGFPLATQPVIAVQDAAGNLVTTYIGTVSASIGLGTGSLTFVNAPVIGGYAAYQSLTLSGPSPTVSLLFQSGSLGQVYSDLISVVSGPPARLIVRTAPALSVTNAVPMVPQPVIEIQDAAGNRVTTPVTVTFVTDAVSGSIANGSATTVNGIATFSGLTLSGPSGARNYQFNAAGLSSLLYRITINP